MNAVQRAASASARIWKAPSALSILYPAHHRATKAPASVASLRQIAIASFSTPCRPAGRHRPAVGAAIRVEPCAYLVYTLPEAAARTPAPSSPS